MYTYTIYVCVYIYTYIYIRAVSTVCYMWGFLSANTEGDKGSTKWTSIKRYKVGCRLKYQALTALLFWFIIAFELFRSLGNASILLIAFTL